MNIYLVTQGILLVYKKIHNRIISPNWHSCSSLQVYKNASSGKLSQDPRFFFIRLSAIFINS